MSLLFSERPHRPVYLLAQVLPALSRDLPGAPAVDWRLGTLDPDEKTVGLLSGIFVAVALYSSIVVNVKRCHDRDHSGWFLLLGLVPILNLWPFIELGFLAGPDGPNMYGYPE